MIPNVLSIAGSDPSGGAGIQADLKTFAAFDVYGCAAITALTVQNTRELTDVVPMPADLVRRQIEAVFADMELHGIKIGMLGSAEVGSTVAALLATHHPPNIVVDPILRAGVGTSLLDEEGRRVLRREVLPTAFVVTPNALETGALLGASPPASLSDMRDAAGALCALGPEWALVTGGHVDTGSECIDVLSDGREVYEFRTPRVAGPARHGTGCTLSSAIAALLALGVCVPKACELAQRYVASTIRAGDELSVGVSRRPLRHVRFDQLPEERTTEAAGYAEFADHADRSVPAEPSVRSAESV
jgi:hydroxymethylpyrimidine/phosphomethylpyrimidine kinase